MKTLVFQFSDLSNMAYLVPSHIAAMDKVRQFVKDNWKEDMGEEFQDEEVDVTDIDNYMIQTQTSYIICDVDMQDVYNTVKANQLHDNDEDVVGTVAVKYPDVFHPDVWSDVCDAWKDYITTNVEYDIYEFVELFNEQHEEKPSYHLVVASLEFYQP